MKIAYLSSAAVPSNSAHSLQVMKMCQAMEQEGHAVTLMLPPAGKPSPVDALNRMYGVNIRFEIRRVELPPILGRRGLAWTLANEAARLAPEMAYTRGVDIGWAAAARGLHTVVEIHSPPTGWFGPFYLRRLLRYPPVRILTISRPLEEMLRKGYPALANRPILVAPDAVDLERYKKLPPPEKARALLGLPQKIFAAGYSGGLVAGRGVEQISSWQAGFRMFRFSFSAAMSYPFPDGSGARRNGKTSAGWVTFRMRSCRSIRPLAMRY